MQPNMKKEYRAELKKLEAKLRWIDRAIDRIHRKHKQRVTTFERECVKQRRAMRMEYDKTLRAMGRPARAMLRRRDILKGRLS
jgi:hypothetical protein